MFVFRLLPKVLASRLLGILERCPVPRGLRPALYGAYVKRYGVDMGEAAETLDAYTSFNAFFTRRLKPGLRPLDARPGAVISPVDGRVVAFGPLERGRLIQAKGLDYSLEELVAAPPVSGSLIGGSYCTIYLAPGDYHRIHSPVDGAVAFTIHIPGTLWPVNDDAARSIRDLFVKNERLLTGIETPAGTVVLVKVGAFNVGSIRTEFDPGAGRGRRMRYRAYAPAKPIVKGRELARFEMGSSVVLLLPRAFTLTPNLTAGLRVKLGEALATRNERLT